MLSCLLFPPFHFALLSQPRKQIHYKWVFLQSPLRYAQIGLNGSVDS